MQPWRAGILRPAFGPSSNGNRIGVKCAACESGTALRKGSTRLPPDSGALPCFLARRSLPRSRNSSFPDCSSFAMNSSASGQWYFHESNRV